MFASQVSGRLSPYKVEQVLRTDGITNYVKFTLTEDNYIDKLFKYAFHMHAIATFEMSREVHGFAS